MMFWCNGIRCKYLGFPRNIILEYSSNITFGPGAWVVCVIWICEHCEVDSWCHCISCASLITAEHHGSCKARQEFVNDFSGDRISSQARSCWRRVPRAGDLEQVQVSEAEGKKIPHHITDLFGNPGYPNFTLDFLLSFHSCNYVDNRLKHHS